MKNFYLISALLLNALILFGQGPNDPQDLNMDVNVPHVWTTVANIENTFNTARRQEETQLGLGANAITDLDLPTQAIWDGYSIDQKALYIMNDERTSRAGINYGMGPVKGLPFNGIEANIDQVAQDWGQYNIDNNLDLLHCHPTMNNADCPAGRIAAAYPGGCTEFGGGIENLSATSSGTIPLADVLLDAILGWNYEDAGSGWGHRHAMLAQDYDDDYGEAMQEGFVGIGIAQTTNAAVQWKTVVVANFTNPVADAQAGACGYNVIVTTNSLTGPPCTTPPTINSVTAVQPPDCNTPVGSITINATGNGNLEYSVDGGANWEGGNVFNTLMPGNYNVSVRLQAMPNCVTTYNQNPVVLNAPVGCNGNCTEYPLTGLNLNIPNNSPAGVSSTINVPTAGTITDINIKGLMGNHTYLGALVFTLQSPQGTTLTLISQACAEATDFNVNLDDGGPAFNCPYNVGNSMQPQNALSIFNGQNAQGNWVLTVADVDVEADNGTLNGWTLEVCTQVAPAQGYTCATAFEINAPGTFNAPGPSQGNGAIAGSGFTHANWYRFTPPMTGMIRIFTCGLAGAGNQHNHVYHVNTASCATLNLNDVVYTEDRGCTQNQADGVKLENVPVTAGVPIYIEWDDALSSTPFTWTLEYMGGGATCTDYASTDVPKVIPDIGAVTSTINVAAGGAITDVNIKNLMGPHSYVGDLTFSLMSPQGTTVILIQNQCGEDGSGFNLGLDDQAGNALSCPLSGGNTQMPENALAAFNGEDPMGNWVLTITDDAAPDGGTLQSWTLEICATGGNPCPPTLPVDGNPIASGAYQAGTKLTSSGTIGAGNNVTFRAGNNVELQNNFSVLRTAVFEIKIEGCQ